MQCITLDKWGLLCWKLGQYPRPPLHSTILWVLVLWQAKVEIVILVILLNNKVVGILVRLYYSNFSLPEVKKPSSTQRS